MLASARGFGRYGIPILGINLGKLGFLTEVAQDQIEEALQRLKNDDYQIEERMALETTIPGINARLSALNDVVVDHAMGVCARAAASSTDRAAVNTVSVVTSVRQSGMWPTQRAGGSRMRLQGAHGRSTRTIRS